MNERKICLMVCLAALAQGCGDPSARLSSNKTPALPLSEQTLKEAVTFQIPDAEKVWGIGIVGNLPGTGSKVCAPQVRSQLRRMMSSSHTEGINLDAFILSPNTAVVYVEGKIQGSAIKSDVFDIQVMAYDDSGACNLTGGWLYRTDLALSKMPGSSMLQTVATAEGAVFMPPEKGSASPNHIGMVLGGGRVVAETATHLILNEPGFKEASLIRNLINNRFGFDTAQATSPAQVDVRVPVQYHAQRWRFWAVIEALPMTDSDKALTERLEGLTQKLVNRDSLDETELALEAMGQAAVPLLGPHLLHTDPAVQLAAARCLINLGFSPALSTLGQMAANAQSPFRVQAMHALKPMIRLPEVQQFVARLLSDPDFEFVMDVYESLCMADGAGVERETVAGAFTLDVIPQNRTQAVIATRSGGAHLALFGGPIQLKPGQLIEFPHKKLTLNSKADNQFVWISRRTSPLEKTVAPVKCLPQLRDIIRVLCEKPGLGNSPGGLGLSYSELLALIGQLSDQGMIPARLWAGPLPELP
ncbi:MAG: flagellar basal body P-ring protein FlgI [Phycisphaerae bacterium]|nr:flagellar basal body P-ring protein FlgI [Phycisphaerae bacterium]